MAKLNYYKFTSNKSQLFQVVAQDYNTAIERFKKKSPFFVGSIKKMEVVPVDSEFLIAVIDQSINTLFVIKLPIGLTNEEIENELIGRDFKLSQISWGEVDEILDERNGD